MMAEPEEVQTMTTIPEMHTVVRSYCRPKRVLTWKQKVAPNVKRKHDMVSTHQTVFPHSSPPLES